VDADEKRFVDELIDASMRGYAGAGPRPGLESRILAGVRAQQRVARRRAAWAWALAMAGVAAMVAFLVFHGPYRRPAPLRQTAKAPVQASVPMAANGAPAEPRPLPLRRVRHAAPSAVDKRPQQFPTPRPLSEQERLLLAYVEAIKGSTAGSAVNATRDVEPDLSISPLSITAIKIEPLDPDEDADGK